MVFRKELKLPLEKQANGDSIRADQQTAECGDEDVQKSETCFSLNGENKSLWTPIWVLHFPWNAYFLGIFFSRNLVICQQTVVY